MWLRYFHPPCSPQLLQCYFITFMIKKKFLPILWKSSLCCRHRIAAHCLISHLETPLQALLLPFVTGKNSPCLCVLSSKCQSYFIGHWRQSPLCGKTTSPLYSPPSKYQVVPKNQRKGFITSKQDMKGGGMNSKLAILGVPLKRWSSWYLSSAHPGSGWNHLQSSQYGY